MSVLKSKNAIQNVILFSLLFMFCGHAFCYANLSFSGASVMVDASKNDASLIADGQYLATLYWHIRGSLSAPLIVGLLSTLYLTAGTLLIADALKLTHPLSLFALCGTLTLHISVTAINASMLHMADVQFLAFLFSVMGAWMCVSHPLGFIPASVCFAAVPGLEPCMFACGPALILIVALLDTLKGYAPRFQSITLLKAALATVIGFAMHYAAALLFCRLHGEVLNAAFHFSPDRFISSLSAPIRQVFAPTTTYALLCPLLMSILSAQGVFSVLFRFPRLKGQAKLFSIICVLLFPLVLLMPVFASEFSTAVSRRFVYVTLPLAMIALIDLLHGSIAANRASILRRLTAIMFGITFMSHIVFANQVYLKKNLEYQSTLSVMTRVIEIAEQTEGFDPSTSTVAIIGSIEDSALSVPHKGFEHLAILDAAANNFTASTQDANTWYFWEIMGYPFNFISDYERDQLAATEEVKAMPAFPDKGCCLMIGNTLVIRLSE